MKNISFSQIACCLNTKIQASVQIRGYRIDSRSVLPGDLFFALPGKRVDGHAFLKEASFRGAVAAVVQRGYQGPSFGLILCFVDDVLSSLQQLARFDLKESQAKVVGITGSVGKTTTKDFLAELLKVKYRVGKTPDNYNTQYTLPLSILNREGQEEIMVLEMGMSDPGDIGRLVEIAPPDIAILTKIALAHAERFPGGLSEIAKYKSEIFSSHLLQKAIYPCQLLDFPSVIDSIPLEKRIGFSLENPSADYFLCDGWICEKGIRTHRFSSPFAQRHLLHNFLAASVAARQLQLQWEEIEERMACLKVPAMRFQIQEKEGITYINDAYNANPESMLAALQNIPQPKAGGRRIGVLGTMACLGSFSQEAHHQVGKAAQAALDYLLVLGEEARPLFEAFAESQKPAEFFLHLPDISKRLEKLLFPGDVVLVKGSRVMKMESLLEFLP